MRKALIPALVLVLGSVVLGATVFRAPLASAAGNVPSIFVANDARSPLPVREQNLDAGGNVKIHEQGIARVESADETRLLLEHHFTTAGEAETLDVGAYREIRVTFSACSTADRLVYVELYQLTDEGRRYGLDRTTISCSGPLSRTYDVPGRRLELTVGDLARPDFWVAVHGRAN